jgi:hypothetical protein
MQLQQLSPRDTLDVPEPRHGMTVKQGLRVAAREGTDHAAV